MARKGPNPKMSVYQPSTVVADDKAVIALRFVESMNFSKDEEELVVEKLKDDVTIRIRTSSGLEYDISMQMQKKIYGSSYALSGDIKGLRNDIFERWLSLIS